MRGAHYSTEVKRQVEKWRIQGKSYAEINREFHVPRSTLSTWLNKKYAHVYKDRQAEHLARSRPLALAAIQRRIQKENSEIHNKVSEELPAFPLTSIGLQKAVISSLYWAEGSKSGHGLKFANTDPNIHRLFITLLRKCFHPDESKFRVHVYVHHYHNPSECREFWSKLLKIPQTQFWKTYTKKRSRSKRFRKNFMGICFVYHSDSRLRKEIMELANQLQMHYK